MGFQDLVQTFFEGAGTQTLRPKPNPSKALQVTRRLLGGWVASGGCPGNSWLLVTTRWKYLGQNPHVCCSRTAELVQRNDFSTRPVDTAQEEWILRQNNRITVCMNSPPGLQTCKSSAALFYSKQLHGVLHSLTCGSPCALAFHKVLALTQGKRL